MYTILFSILFSAFITASTWNDINSPTQTKTKLEASSDNLDITSVNFDIDGFHLMPVDVNGSEMFKAHLNDGASLLLKGAPDLHKYAKSIIIPNDKKMSFKIISSNFIDYENILIAPSKGNINRSVDLATVPFEFSKVYQKDSFYPGNLVSLESPYVLRDLRGQSIVFFPFQYNPVTKLLRVYKNIEIEVYSDGPGTINVLNDVSTKQTIQKEFSSIYNNHFINYSSDSRFEYLEDHGNLLIISYGSFMDTMQPLVDWKKIKGIPTEMVNVSDIGSSSSAISSYVDNYYYENGLTFLLLVGDIAQIPSPSVSGSASDPSYGFISGNDSYAEVIVGRFSGSTPSQIATQVERSISYERFPQIGASWYDNALGVASNQGPGFGGYSDDDFNDFLWNTVLSDFTYDSYQGIYDGSGGTASQGISAINNGVSIINYTGHGSISSWGNGAPLSTSNINSLTNNNLLPFVITVGCNVGEFNSTNECYAESWLRATNNGEPTGGISHFGSTISQSWEPPMHGQYGMNLILTESYDQNLTRTMGGITTNGCMYMNDAQGSSGINETNYWTYFGDPTVPLRTAPPSTISAVYDDVVILGSSNFNVSTGTEGDLVALSKSGNLLVSAYTDRFGTATLELGEQAQVPGELDIVITGFNYFPHESTIMVLSPDGPYVMAGNSSVSSGNDDIIEYGETVELSMILENVGSNPAYNISVSISTDDDFITITNSSISSFNSIDPDGTLLIEGLEFEVSGDIPNNYNFDINCDMSDNLNNLWTTSLTFTAYAPELSIDSIVGDLDPGQTADIAAIISNIGGTQITYPFVVVQSDEYITINVSSFSNAYSLEVGMDASLELNVTVSPNAPIGHLAFFDVAIVANLGDGPITNTSFEIPIGQVTAGFEDGLGALEWDLSCEGVGCLNWDLDNNNSSSGSSSIRSGLIGDNQRSDFSVTLDVTTDGQIAFDYRVEAEYSTSGNYFYDGLEFYIDNTLQQQYQTSSDGSSSWNSVSYDVLEGMRTFRWSFVKDGGGGSTDCLNTDCEDAAWVDDIVFPPAYIESDTIFGDINFDGIVNILDVVLMLNIILEIDPYNSMADLNSDGIVNILDVVQEVNLILGPRFDNASQIELFDTGKEINMVADGYVGAIKLILNHDDNFSLSLNEDAFLPYSHRLDNQTTIFIINPQSNHLFNYFGDFEIVEFKAANSIDYIKGILPQGTHLNEAYPNPFNPVTNIGFTLAKESIVNLSIFNIQGQLVETLISNKIKAGNYNFKWDATLQPSGMYVLRLDDQNSVYNQKLMVVK